MFGQPVIILSKPIVSAKILNTCPGSAEHGHCIKESGAELISQTHLYSNSNDNDSNYDLKTQNAELSYVCQILNDIAEKLNKHYENIFTKHREEIARLSVEISRKILAQKIGDGDYKIEMIIQEAMKNVQMHQDLEIHLNPKDFQLCQKALQDKQECSLNGMKLISDPEIGQAECMVKSPRGIVQSFIEEQLEQIGEALKKA